MDEKVINNRENVSVGSDNSPDGSGILFCNATAPGIPMMLSKKDTADRRNSLLKKLKITTNGLWNIFRKFALQIKGYHVRQIANRKTALR